MIRKFYSQAGQDRWVAEDVFNYQLGGYFLDIGAFDGVFLSNTFWLERNLGWKGVCIEADPATFHSLNQNRRCLCIHACVGSEGKQVNFASGRGPYSGKLSSSLDELDSAQSTLHTLSLSSILAKTQAPRIIDYLSLDVEGMEDEVMSTFPFEQYRIRCATIERPSEHLRRTMQSYGYMLVADQPGMDAYYLHPEMTASYMGRAILKAETASLALPRRIVKLLSLLPKLGLRNWLRRL